jgi:hypothetical protein
VATQSLIHNNGIDATTEIPQGDLVAAIDAWRGRGADRFDPVRFRFIEVMARKAAACDGQARAMLDSRVAALLDAYVAAVRSAPFDASDGMAVLRCTSELAELVDYIAQQAATVGDPLAAGDLAPSGGSLPELKTLRYFRGTWAKLSAHQRLAQSLAKMPENAGPLNSQSLVHRSLTLMRELSPEYLDRFMSYVDALLWLDGMKGGDLPTGKIVPRAEKPSRRARR